MKTTTAKAPDVSISFADAQATLRQDASFKRAIVRIPFPVIYFCVFVAMIFTHMPTTELYSQGYSVASTLASSGTDVITDATTMKFYNIQTIGDVFDWIIDTFIPSVFVTQDYNELMLGRDKWGRIANFNKVLGAVNFEVTRAANHSCQTELFLQKLYPNCYDPSNVDRKNTFIGFDKNVTEATALITRLKKNGTWLDFSTQQLVITVVTYNGELQGYAVTKMTLNFNQGGYIDLSSTTTPALSDPYQSNSALLSDILVWICFAITSAVEVRNLVRHRRDRTYLTSLWTLVEVGAVAFVITYYAIWAGVAGMLHDSEFKTNLADLVTQGREFSGQGEQNSLVAVTLSLQHIAHMTIALRLVATVAVLFLGLRILKRFRFHPRLSILTRTIGNALHQFGAFFIVFVVIYMTFAVSGTILFGDQVQTFSSLQHSMETCVNMLFGNFDYTTIQSIYSPVAMVYYWGYMIIVSLVLLNMMLAIVLDSYADISQQSAQSTVNASLRRILRNLWWDLRHGVWRYKTPIHKPDAKITSGWKRQELMRGGRILPDVLLEVVTHAMVTKADDTQLTVATLQSLFPMAQLTEEEATQTIQFLLGGIKNHTPPPSPQKNEEVDKPSTAVVAPVSALKLNQVAVTRNDETTAAVVCIPPPPTDAQETITQLSTKLELLEQKLDRLLSKLES